MRSITNPEADDERVTRACRRPVGFGIGRVTITPGAKVALYDTGENHLDYLLRHRTGQWGETPADERAENIRAARTQRGSILSMHRTKAGARLWLATTDDRSSTTIFTPEEVGSVGIFDEREERDAIAA